MYHAETLASTTERARHEARAVPNGKRHAPEGMPTSDLIAPAADTSRLLEQVASEPSLATALLNVARNKGAPGVDGHPTRGAQDDLAYVVGRLRRAWPGVRIYLRGDSGFGIPTMYQACEQLDIDYTLGIGMNTTLTGWPCTPCFTMRPLLPEAQYSVKLTPVPKGTGLTGRRPFSFL